ncbi:sigma 54-interacting transcriptional regulator [Sedimentibacter hydroxybenzoicus DSM 7310]|uniref:Sigma 54-interacting transcriptional regulator n=1 Tax=Sedimentibacter hydroxybenzoicus DSM 7310 TaxID=1123245 RepID=A0A974BI16_SEDHY|nr:sigma 54-interacting transcriptional regulator [Sedimentibacter hydroxybenzoicus]NYB73241.1 sigma 54-interacting transcriptional regulator [Sedimentibacter hydroxybenzoicus DSM 7310]
MIENFQLLQLITDCLEDGIIFVDKDYKVKLFNQNAKRITGIIFDKYASHDAGKIEEGDIVILADSAIGEDDGCLSPKDLSLINIKDSDIRANDCILGIGVYGNAEILPVYKYLRGANLNEDFVLEANYLGFQIQICIETMKKKIHIRVNGDSYSVSFLGSFGHMVIIDGKSGVIKFFQAKGYTIRKESIKEILHGRKFFSKDSKEDPNVIGEKIDDLFMGDKLLQSINSVLSGNEPFIPNDFFEINKRLVLCSMRAIEDKQGVQGVLLNIQDVSELEKLLDYRNQILMEVEKSYTNRTPIYGDISKDAFAEFIGNSHSMVQLKYLAYKASKTKFNVIITGESGTGKSLLARLIHEEYNKSSPFIEVNCNAIAPTLFESELFGYVGGAFTGALSSGRSGYFENANGGTIFLDEIGDLPLEIQVKLLYVLQNKIIYRVGSSKPIPIDVRVIAATNKNLEEEVMNGRFRQDLYFRINVFPITIPPLRERKSDLYMLINKILNKICTRYDFPQKQLSGEALDKLLRYNWPGNVRELENIIERAITLCETNWIYPEQININDFSQAATSMQEQMQEAEKKFLKDALIRANGNKAQAMKDLGMSKSVFYEKLKKHAISN